MAKKENGAYTAGDTEKEKLVLDEPLFESEAYGNPQPDEGMETTVTKHVGLGGPVPIVAPKYKTIQLQPIVVPLAVVPYMTQDTNVLRTDARQPQQSPQFRNDSYAEAVDFETAANGNRPSKNKLKARLFALILVITSCLVAVPFIIAYFHPVIGDSIFLTRENIIGDLISWANGAVVVDKVLTVLMTIGAGTSALLCLMSLVSVFIGKLSKVGTCTLSLISAASLLSVLIYEVAVDNLIPEHRILFIAAVALSLLTFVLSASFSISLVKTKPSKNAQQNII